MDTAMVKDFGTLLHESDLRLLRDLGYSGVAPIASSVESWQHLIRFVVPWTEQYRLRLPAVYSWIKVRKTGFLVDPGIAANVSSLRDANTTIWLPVNSSDFQPSDPAADEITVAAVREAADAAAEKGCSVSLYPHFGSVIQRVDDAIRVAQQCDRPNVRITFNLCHWLRTDGPNGAREMLHRAAPLTSLVTINGANRDGHSWPELIQPLDQGTFRVRHFLDQLRQSGYRGPIGLQGYDVAKTFHIEPQENLKRSMAAWRRMTS